MKLIFELPFKSTTCGGVIATQLLAKELGAKVKYQTGRKAPYYYEECDWWITYSDNPHSKELFLTNKIKHVACYFQSYGMSYQNERYNAEHPNILNLCSTKKIEEAIIRDGFECHRIGFGLETKEFYDKGEERKNYLAILYHDMPSKKYDISVRVADLCLSKGIIEGVISFGTSKGYNSVRHPKGLVKHYENASKAQVAEVFNRCKAYLMPSISEGLNLTPIESTLCGCPSIIVDGAINEIFFNTDNCDIAKKNDIFEMEQLISRTIKYYTGFSIWYETKMREQIKDYTWSNVAEKLKAIL
jgi:glycosyltransferase involved in cell wall biosynthesis